MNHSLSAYLESQTLVPQLGELDAQRLAAELSNLTGLQVYPRSIAAADNCVFFLNRQNASKLVGVLAASTARHKVRGENRSVRLDATEALLTIGQTSTSMLLP